MKIVRRTLTLFFVLVLFICQIVPVHAENNESEWFPMVEENYEDFNESTSEIEPYTMYLMNVHTYLSKLSSNKLGLRADVFCSSTVKTIQITFYLQKQYGTTWKNVSSGVASASNVSTTVKQMTVSSLTSGVYRAKTVTMVVDSLGYAEAVTSYSGALRI